MMKPGLGAKKLVVFAVLVFLGTGVGLAQEELIRNGGFETGDLSEWDWFGFSTWGGGARRGLYYACSEADDGYIEQRFAATSVDDIIEASMWAYMWYQNGGSGPVQVRFYYSDSSTSQTSFVADEDWTYSGNLKSTMSLGKKLCGIRITNISGEPYATNIDEVSVKYTGTGVKEGHFLPQAPRSKPGPTVVRGSLLLPSVLFSSYALLGSDGRKVMDLAPGENDTRHLSAGVYYATPTSRDCGDGILKVIVIR